MQTKATPCEISEHLGQRKDPKNFQDTKQATDKGVGIRLATHPNSKTRN